MLYLNENGKNSLEQQAKCFLAEIKRNLILFCMQNYRKKSVNIKCDWGLFFSHFQAQYYLAKMKVSGKAFCMRLYCTSQGFPPEICLRYFTVVQKTIGFYMTLIYCDVGNSDVGFLDSLLHIFFFLAIIYQMVSKGLMFCFLSQIQRIFIFHILGNDSDCCSNYFSISIGLVCKNNLLQKSKCDIKSRH